MLGWGPCYYMYVAVPEDGRAGVNPVNDQKLAATFFFFCLNIKNLRPCLGMSWYDKDPPPHLHEDPI